ncbi:MAG TPA: glycosyltransferase family 2 protein [Polyangiaceae bacterium]|nr:glycosyltransferase family 2 protein [Polyangiaceae bacterium]
MDRPTLSLVLPVYNEEVVIPELDRRLRDFLAVVGVSWEVIFINDGSKDRSFELLQAMALQERRYRVFSFSRNFGHQLAITAGVDLARGEAVVIMDADLQDPPEVVAQMLERWREGFDVVYGVRRTRHSETFFKKATAAAFYRLLRAMVGVPIPVDAGDFRLMSRRVVLTLRALRETSRFVRGMVAWVGFKQTAVHYERAGRFAGDTHYPLKKMLKFAMDGITSFSIVPLRIATWLGVLAGFAAILVAFWAVYVRVFKVASAVPGWATIMIAVSLAASAQLLMTGILGEYVGRIYEEVKRRPLYVIQERIDAFADESEAVSPESDTRGRAARIASS